MTDINNPSAITPEYIGIIIKQIASDNNAVSDDAYYSLSDRAEDLADAYIKLHEENQRLRDIFVTFKEKIMIPVPTYYPIDPGQTVGRVDWENISLIDILKEIDEALALTH